MLLYAIPQESGGSIEPSDVTTDSLVLNWNAASDNIAEQSDLQYALYQSGFANIDPITRCETNGQLVRDFTKNIQTADITGLQPDDILFQRHSARPGRK